MTPATIKATLRLLGLCAVLLLLAAAVTVSVAVVVWNSDAAWQWRQCQARARNETARLAELEGEAGILRRRLEEGTGKENDLRQQLSQANHSLKQLDGTLASCRNHAEMLRENLTALEDSTTATRMEYTEAELKNKALLEDLDTWKGKMEAMTRVLEEARRDYHNLSESQRGLESQGEECRTRNAQLEDTVRGHVAEIERLRGRLRSGSAGHQCPRSWQLVGLAASSLLFLTEVLNLQFS